MFRRHIWLAVPLMLLAGFGAACSDDDDDPGTQQWRATLNGANERPPVTTTATGTATFTRSGNTINYTIAITSAITAARLAHIHLGTQDTASGSITVPLFTSNPTTGQDFATGATLTTGSFTAANVTLIPFDSLIARMNTGRVYVNVHTAANPGGAIRGQVNPF